MTKLNDAIVLRLGSQQVSRAMLGTIEAWALGTEYAQWGATSIYGQINGDTAIATVPGGPGEAGFVYGDAPLSGKVYFEADIRSDLSGTATSTGVGVAAYLGGAIPTHGIGATTTELDVGSSSSFAFAWSSVQIIANMAAIKFADTHIYRFGFNIDVAQRKVWVRQIAPDGSTGPEMLQSGGVSGDPTYVVPGTDPIYIAGSVRGDSNAYAKLITDPVDFASSPMSGFSAIPPVATRITVTGGMVSGDTGTSSGSGYSVSGGTAPYTFVHAGAVPGITFNADGTRSGTYLEGGEYIHYTTAVDANGRIGQLREAITVTGVDVVPDDLTAGAFGVGSFNGTSYPYEIGVVTLNTRESGSGFLLYAVMEAGHPGAVSASDNKGNTYTLLSAATGAGGTNRSYLFWSPGGAGGTGHTLTFHGPAGVVTYPTVFALEINGSGLIVDQYDELLDTAAPLESGTITPTTGGQAIVAFTGGRTDGPITIAAPFSLIASQESSAGGSGGFYTGAAAHFVQETAAAVNSVWAQAGNAYALNHIVSIRKE